MDKQCEYCGKQIGDMLRRTRKYCDDNCKQLAYYARQGVIWGQSGNAPAPGGENLSGHNVKPDFTLNPEITGNSTEQKPEIEKTKPTEPYQWMSSYFLDRIEHYRNKENAEAKFLAPHYYWSAATQENVGWVTTRYRCLLDNIIRLCGKRIDRATVKRIARAFAHMIEAWSFRALPPDYPFTGRIHDLKLKFEELAGDDDEHFILTISTDRKAQMIADRFVIGKSVTWLRFSSLKFSDSLADDDEEEEPQEDENS